MSKHALSRTAALLAASAAALAMATGTATAAPAGPGAHAASTTGTLTGANAAKATDPKVELLRRALAKARAQRADARAAYAPVQRALTEAALVARTSEESVLDARRQQADAKAALTDARTVLSAARAAVADATDAVAANDQARSGAAAAHTTAIGTRDTASALRDTLDAQRSDLATALDDATAAVVAVEADIARLTGTQIPQATGDLAAKTAEVDTLRPQRDSAFTTYTQRTWAYPVCTPLPDATVNCMDNSGVWAIRGEVSSAYATYKDLDASLATAVAQQSTLAATLADLQGDLAEAEDLRDDRLAATALAQSDLDRLDADRADANDAVVAAQAEVDEQAHLLDALTVEATRLSGHLTSATEDEKAADAVETAKAQAVDVAVRAVQDATTTLRAHLDREDVARRSAEIAHDALLEAQDRARRVKQRLVEARQHH